jgi:hypothetical protein
MEISSFKLSILYYVILLILIHRLFCFPFDSFALFFPYKNKIFAFTKYT